MSEMIERVARAIHKASYPDEAWEDRQEYSQNAWRREARAAIEAMEPFILDRISDAVGSALESACYDH